MSQHPSSLLPERLGIVLSYHAPYDQLQHDLAARPQSTRSHCGPRGRARPRHPGASAKIDGSGRLFNPPAQGEYIIFREVSLVFFCCILSFILFILVISEAALFLSVLAMK